MGLLSKIAMFARKWIGLAVAWRQKNSAELDIAIGAIKEIAGENRRVTKILEIADQIEAGPGALTDFWGKLEGVPKGSGATITFTADEIKYVRLFKTKVWDKLWKPFKKQAKKEPDDTTLEAPATMDVEALPEDWEDLDLDGTTDTTLTPN